MEKEKVVDPIIEPIGQLGRYQLFICLLVFLSKFPTGWITLAIVFLGAPIKHTCLEPSNSTDVCSSNCTKVEYDHSIFKETPTTEWGLICDRKYLVSISQMLVMFGVMIGSMIFGIMSDKLGRRPAFISCCMFLLVTGLLVSYSPCLEIYLLLRLLSATATGGIMVTSFVVCMEIVGKKYREIIAILYQIPFNMGHASLPAFAYYFRNWRDYHLAFSSTFFIYFIYFCLLPESPRWLLSTGRVEKSAEVIELYARRNGKPTEKIRADLEEAHKRLVAKEPIKKGKLADLFRTPFLRAKTLAMGFAWLVVCLAYYGTSQYISNLGGNIFMNVFYGAILGIPGTIACVPLTMFLGRKKTLIFSNALSGISLTSIALVPNDKPNIQVILATIGLFGASITFPNVYLYGGELFPTVVRNSGVGFCSFIGRFGSMLAPFISQLATHGLWIPPMIIGVCSIMAALTTFILPETRGLPLPETLEDGENFGKKKPNTE